jgi:hypothetical protein
MGEVNLLEHWFTLRHAIRAQPEDKDEKTNHSGSEQGSSANSETGQIITRLPNQQFT